MIRRRYRTGLCVLLALALIGSAVGLGLRFLGGDRFQRLPAHGRFDGTVALFLSGDAGLKFGMGRPVTQSLAMHGIPVIGVSSPAAFRETRTRRDVDAVLSDGIRLALRTPGAKRVVLIGQSFGADMLATSAPDVPPDLRRWIAAVVLVVPARTVFYRSDPLGLAYHGTPDGEPASGMRGLDWAPVLCVQGAAEIDSLCPLLEGTSARRITLPGGHFLNHDEVRLIATILATLHALGLAS